MEPSPTPSTTTDDTSVDNSGTPIFDRKAFDAMISNYIRVLAMNCKPAETLLQSCVVTIDQRVDSIIDVIRVFSFLEASSMLRGQDICKFFDFVISSAQYWHDKTRVDNQSKLQTDLPSKEESIPDVSTSTPPGVDTDATPPPPTPPSEKIQIIHYDTVDLERFKTMCDYVKSVGYFEVVERISEVLLSKAERDKRQSLAVMYSKRSIETSIEQRNFGDILLMVNRVWQNLMPEAKYLCNTLSQTHVRTLMIIVALYLMNFKPLVYLVHACVDHTLPIVAPPSVESALNPEHVETVQMAIPTKEEQMLTSSLIIILFLEASDAVNMLQSIQFISPIAEDIIKDNNNNNDM